MAQYSKTIETTWLKDRNIANLRIEKQTYYVNDKTTIDPIHRSKYSSIQYYVST